jgi:hypothetical protein
MLESFWARSSCGPEWPRHGTLPSVATGGMPLTGDLVEAETSGCFIQDMRRHPFTRWDCHVVCHVMAHLIQRPDSNVWWGSFTGLQWRGAVAAVPQCDGERKL